MRDISDAADLVATAREALLAEILPGLPKERRYVGLMIANVMAIAAREHRLGADAAGNEAARLRNRMTDLGDDASLARGALPFTDLTALRRSVATAIRAGAFDDSARAKALGSDLLHTAADWVAISNPKALRPDAATTTASSRGPASSHSG